ARNRIIAGLAAVTVVVEARERSGALITADFALDEGREVLAVPGEITSALSAGCNRLLRLGATPVTSTADVLEAFGLAETAVVAPTDETPELRLVRTRLDDGAASVDELALATGLEASAVAAAIAALELAGEVSVEDGLARGVMPQG